MMTGRRSRAALRQPPRPRDGRRRPREAGLDPTTFSVVWNRLESLLDESGEKVLHATQSYVLALVRDFGLSWLNPERRDRGRGRLYRPPHLHGGQPPAR